MEIKLVFTTQAKYRECDSEHGSQKNVLVYERGRK
jgi:hypothetical protein